jgi:hypothetical protein
VQECAPEDEQVKRDLFAGPVALDAPGPALVSSSSMTPTSRFASELAGRSPVLVAYPGSPPYLLPVVELVPAPFTAPDTVETAAELLERAGKSVVRLRHEVEGFVFDRLPGALLREAYCLMRDGSSRSTSSTASFATGLAVAGACSGRSRTSDLDTRGGIEAHAARMGSAYGRIGAGRRRGQHDPWTPELVARVAAKRRALLPLGAWDEQVAWRDRMLMLLKRCRPRA